MFYAGTSAIVRPNVVHEASPRRWCDRTREAEIDKDESIRDCFPEALEARAHGRQRYRFRLPASMLLTSVLALTWVRIDAQ
jgi:hypothetical protein